jgi:hypothetical protein
VVAILYVLLHFKSTLKVAILDVYVDCILCFVFMFMLITVLKRFFSKILSYKPFSIILSFS